MHAAQRHDAILRALHRNGFVNVGDLAEQLSTSMMTIRRDLSLLAQRGSLHKVHGGAVLPRPAATATAPAPRIGPAAKRQRVVGMLIPAASYYYNELIQGAHAAAQAHRVRLAVSVSHHDPSEDQAHVAQLLAEGAEGLLLTTSHVAGDSATPSWLSALTVPMILLERRQPIDLGPVECVVSDHEHGTIQALRHLAGLGHRRIALFTLRTPTGFLIHRGFEMAAGMLGLARDVPLVSAASADELDAAVDAALDTGATAILAHPDDVTVTLLHRLRAKGLAVPDDISIVSYDDEIAAYADVPLTAVAPPRRALGHTAMEMLIRRIHGAEPHVMRHVSLLPRLCVRNSTGPRGLIETSDTFSKQNQHDSTSAV